MDLSIIIVNFHSADHVINCIRSIVNAGMKISHEMIVVDNKSGVEDEKRIRENYPQIKWIQTGYNAGFARANNIGIKSSSGNAILLLNADTIVKENAIERVYHRFISEPQYVACGVQLLNLDGTYQHSGAKFMKGGANILLPLPYLGNWIRSIAYAVGVKQPNVFNVNEDVKVDWIIGAFIMTKREHIETAGMLDEDFFMYAEEIEWCARLRKIGPLVLYKDMPIVHLGGGSSTQYYQTQTYDNSYDLWSKKGRQIMVSQMLRVRRQWGLFWYILMLTFYFIEIPVFFMGYALTNVFTLGRSRFRFDQCLGFLKNMILAIPDYTNILFNRHKFYKVG